MKVLITTGIFPPDIGGPASYGSTLARELSKNFSVALITYSSRSKFPDDKNQPFKIVRVAKWIPKFLRHIVFFLKTLSAAKDADVIFSLNAVSAGLPSLWAAKMGKKKFFVKIVGDYAWETAVNKSKTFFLIDDFQKPKRRGWIGILHKLQTKVCKGADSVIVPSAYLANMVKNWGVPEGKIKVVYNGVDPVRSRARDEVASPSRTAGAATSNGVDFKKADMSKEEARKEIGIAGNIILSVGRLVPWKGFRMLIKIMPQLLEINQFVRLVIAGDGPERRALDSIIKNMRLENKVFLVGGKSKRELSILMAAADVFILNTAYEGFSHQILEAMAAGVPVVTTAVGGNREVIRQGENGFMVRYNDEFNLMEAIKTIWQTPELRERFIEEGRKTVERFSREKMISETVKILTS